MELTGFEGRIISAIHMDKCIAERAFFEGNTLDLCNDSELTNHDVEQILKEDFRSSHEWVLHLGVCLSKGRYYLCLEGNEESGNYECLVAPDDSDIAPLNLGIANISKEKANEIVRFLSPAEPDTTGCDVQNFSLYMHCLMESIPCRFRFTHLYNRGGFYCKSANSITLAVNQPQLNMLFSAIHEMTHFLLNSEKTPPKRVKDYLSDSEENICNAVASVLLKDRIIGSEPYSADPNFQARPPFAALDDLRTNLIVSLSYCKGNRLMDIVYAYTDDIMERVKKVGTPRDRSDIPLSKLFCDGLTHDNLQYILREVSPLLEGSEDY